MSALIVERLKSSPEQFRPGDPAKLSLSGSFVSKHHRAVLSGRLQTPSAPVSGLTVGLYRRGWDGWRRVGSTRTTVNGSYRFVRPIKKTTTFGTAVWAVGDCSGDSTAPKGCVNETRAEVDSPSVRIVVRRGPLGDLVAWAADGVRGEVTIVVAGASATRTVGPDPDDWRAAVTDLESTGTPRKQAIADVAKAAGVPKRLVYDAVHRV